ncbi:calcium-activated chloride channel regulator 4-like [Mercenaria mercenaria]|uniref:calcium-activated chloride channel regulator 4-like n=1 Tax=Mercenaria mercenaria TaxID=6596 RepID=UPI00234EA39F|nr:calcium-activated chloride channel regulator 4-like [Mercenaria mercenaria]
MANINFVLFCLLIGEISPIFVKNGRYEDLYIVIQDNNEDNEVLLERIKEVFTAASKLLFTATRNHLYFGKIKVVVPKTWSLKTEYKRLIVPSQMKQYISVDKYGDGVPKVYGLTKCGRGGSYMYLNSLKFILTEGSTNWGNHDNVIVHEWGHLRYGLYDEYPVTKPYYPTFYQAAGKWNPVRCTNLIQGRVGMGAGCDPSTECNTEDASKILNERCKFCPDREQKVDASLMGFQWINVARNYFLNN